jgi:LacI family transcriptional regulator
VTTVSHVLNDVPDKRIAVATRERVRAAAEELAYRPNHVARGLRLRRSNTIGFVSDEVGTSPFAGMMILGAQQAATEIGSLLMLMSTYSEPELEAREIRALLDRRVDGIVYAIDYHRVVSVPAALDGVATVLCGRVHGRPADSERGARRVWRRPRRGRRAGGTRAPADRIPQQR